MEDEKLNKQSERSFLCQDESINVFNEIWLQVSKVERQSSDYFFPLLCLLRKHMLYSLYNKIQDPINKD